MVVIKERRMAAMDALDMEIASIERECDELRSRLADKERELEALKRAASLRPLGYRRQSDSASGSQRGGRQPGAISMKWRAIMKAMAAHYPQGATPDLIASFGPALGLKNLKPKDARVQAEKYTQLGYFEAAGDRYKVTPMARDRFGLSETPEPSNTETTERIAAE
jgi:hypothetical protein